MLTHRPLTQEEALLLHEEIKTTPNILGYTVEMKSHPPLISGTRRRITASDGAR
jgi:hypothetical protein